MFTNFITSYATFLRKKRLLLHSYDSTLHAHRKFYVDLHFLCLSFIRNSCHGVITYPWGLLAGNPINKFFPSWLQRLFVSRRSNYRYCCITTCSTKICPILIFLAFCSYLPQREFCDADVLLQPHKHVLGDPVLRTVPYRSNLYWAVILEGKTYMSVSNCDNIGRLTRAACCTLTNHT